MKRLMAGGGVALIGITLVPLLPGLFARTTVFPGKGLKNLHLTQPAEQTVPSVSGG